MLHYVTGLRSTRLSKNIATPFGWLEAIGVGLGTVAFVAFMANTTHPAYTATQFALFTSLMAMPRTFANAATGWLVETMGWTMFFLLCAGLAVPGMVLLLKVAPWGNSMQDANN